MIGERRRREIVARLQRSGYVEARTLAEDLGVDVSTIRRDLDALGRAGLVQRTHGGALAMGGAEALDVPYEAKRLERLAEKRAIAEYVADLVSDGDSLVLDSGSSTYALAEALQVRNHLTVATNDIRIAHYFAARRGVRLLVSGGQLIDSVFTLVGAATLAFLSSIHLDWAFLGADAIDAHAGVSNVNTVEVPVKQAMISAADRAVLLADSSKFGRRALAAVVGIDAFEAIVTDDGLPAEERDRFGARLVCVRTADQHASRKSVPV
ncbi:MAG: DeoR/GlpR family DNA-binding transcription regulator [Acidimicrobiales bacterium]